MVVPISELDITELKGELIAFVTVAIIVIQLLFILIAYDVISIFLGIVCTGL